ncbi:diguanylate cyclase [Tepiditoga spiralis]|uniref:Diguanylate cyclase n=1 Tax=Tepiditoga spiralis TaxID=2108365 RepID=A0A7G1G3N8_9BACT|nr:sensor domain-containing diguanylate cyclase [Tepiditoga spiralis]BBE30645.1 diguanylate cyclase [Tepiditoga spiralis]
MEFELKYAKEILENIEDGVYILDNKRKILYWNKAAEKITGFKSEEVLGSSCKDNILMHIDENGVSLCMGMCPVAFTLADGRTRKTKVFLHHKKGHRVPVYIKVFPIKDENGNITGAVELFNDISEKEKIEIEAKVYKKMALTDKLTEIPNRAFIDMKLQEFYQESNKYGLDFGILFIDIDNFKNINDTYGHDFGDKILKMVSQSIFKNTRSSDFIGRWGGDEFIAIIRFVDKTLLYEIANRYLMMVKNSYLMINEKKISVNISIGGSLYENNTIDEIIKKADEALYYVKENGKANIKII